MDKQPQPSVYVGAPRVQPDIAYQGFLAPEQQEVIEGVLRNGQIAALGGAFGQGKTPLLHDWIVHLANGLPWCGRAVARRPVILLDFESNPSQFDADIERLCERLGVPPPSPSCFRRFLLLSNPRRPDTKLLYDVLEKPTVQRVLWLRDLLRTTPDAVVMIDPADMFFGVDLKKDTHVVPLYRVLRTLLAEHPKAAFLFTFNLRKHDRKGHTPELLLDPYGWLEEIAGSIMLLARADVRMGLEWHQRQDRIRILNGVRRGEDFEPLLLSEVGEAPNLAGFALATADAMLLGSKLTVRQLQYWNSLPPDFKFEDFAGKGVPRSSLWRLLQLARRMGAVEQNGDLWHKRSG